MSEIVVEPVTENVDFGEAPHWSVEEQCLYYVDIFGGYINRYHPATETHSKLHIVGGPVTPVVPHRDLANTLVIGLGRSIAAVTWPDPTQDHEVENEIVTLAQVEEGLPDHRFNDGKADANGRLWAGTMSEAGNPKESALYRMEQDASITPMVEQVGLCNGLAWTQDNSTMYFIDTNERQIYGFDFDLSSGTVSNRRVVFDFATDPALESASPDGMTLDIDGNIWVAGYGSGKVFQVDPTAGQVLGTVSGFPPQTTSVAWGGPDLDQLYVTTFGGPVYRVSGLGTKGLPAATCIVDLPTPKDKH